MLRWLRNLVRLAVRRPSLHTVRDSRPPPRQRYERRQPPVLGQIPLVRPTPNAG